MLALEFVDPRLKLFPLSLRRALGRLELLQLVDGLLIRSLQGALFLGHPAIEEVLLFGSEVEPFERIIPGSACSGSGSGSGSASASTGSASTGSTAAFTAATFTTTVRWLEAEAKK
jgi:hypothetical protein